MNEVQHTFGRSGQRRKLALRLAETAKHFWDLGFTSFGGPGVHVVIFRRRFVDQLDWLDATTFADLFSLGNALPGPGSTQLAFSIALVRNGTLAGLLAFALWSLPGAAGMAGLAAGVRALPETLPAIVLALLTGLNAAAVGLIALAAFQLSSNAVTDRITRLIVFGSAAFGICYHAPWMYPALMAAGGITTLVWDFRQRLLALFVRRHPAHKQDQEHAVSENARTDSPPVQSRDAEDIELHELPAVPSTPRRDDGSVKSLVRSPADAPAGEVDITGAPPSPRRTPSPPPSSLPSGIRQRPSATAAPVEPSTTNNDDEAQQAPERTATQLMTLGFKPALAMAGTFIAVVVVFVVVRASLTQVGRAFDFFVNMIIAGTIIFGGGPVVIPLLRGYTVDNGWVSSRDFLLGFAILQAFPGPNFNFAVYLGLLALAGRNPALGAFLGYLGIFTPGILLKLAMLPLYSRWRRYNTAKSVLRGLNAAAAGLVYTAVWQLFLVGYLYQPATGPTSSGPTTSGPLTADPWWGVVAGASFVASQWFASPPAVSILGGGLAGLAWYGVTSR